MLIDEDGRFNRAAIMSKAHHEFRLARMRGDTRGFGYWLAYCGVSRGLAGPR